jgi:hypothetical protein
MVIDPLEAIITWLETALTVVSGRVAAKQRYGEGWTETQTGVSVHLDGGAPDLYAKVTTMRLELRIYANDQVDIVTVWRALVDLSRANMRFTVAVTGGRALVHRFHPESLLSLLYDDVLKMDMGMVFFEAMVSEEDAS